MIKGSDFIVVNLPKDVVAKLGAEGFEFVERVAVEQGFIDVDKLFGQVMRFVVEGRQVVIATNAGGNRH